MVVALIGSFVGTVAYARGIEAEVWITIAWIADLVCSSPARRRVARRRRGAAGTRTSSRACRASTRRRRWGSGACWRASRKPRYPEIGVRLSGRHHRVPFMLLTSAVAAHVNARAMTRWRRAAVEGHAGGRTAGAHERRRRGSRTSLDRHRRASSSNTCCARSTLSGARRRGVALRRGAPIRATNAAT